MRRLTSALLTVTLPVTLTLAGCGSSSTARSPTTVNTPTTLPTGVTSAVPPTPPLSTRASASPTASTPTSATPDTSVLTTTTPSSASTTLQRCHTAELRVTQTVDAAAAGNEGLNVIFENVGPAACTVYGYPGIGLVSISGSLLNTTVARGNGSMLSHDHGPQLLTVTPNGTVSATLGYNVVESGCDQVSGLLVTPPDETSSATVRIGSTGSLVTMCRPAITALVLGAAGSTS